jgi:hypothetical protein
LYILKIIYDNSEEKTEKSKVRKTPIITIEFNIEEKISFLLTTELSSIKNLFIA